MSEPRELRYWMAVFGVSEEEIRRAVAAVGVSASAVKRYLER
ncbi:DUF3606 domain-containing protein [Achromobacter insolitus]|nr:DUF3606 domain-containing protein [Achromobacter insolitus]